MGRFAASFLAERRRLFRVSLHDILVLIRQLSAAFGCGLSPRYDTAEKAGPIIKVAIVLANSLT
jgi:hypothetical protein